MTQHKWLLKAPWMLILVGGFLCLVSVTKKTELWDAKFELTAGLPLILLGIFGALLVLTGAAIALLSAVRYSPIRALPLIGRDSIYIAARQMIEKCAGDEIIRATSIATTMPGDDESDHPLVAAYLNAVVNKCAEAKLQSKSLAYRTVLGFSKDSEGIPPEHKKLSIVRRRDLFRAHGVERSLDMRYIETDWSLDVLIVAPDQMLIAFPTMPGDRRLRMGIRLENHDFVQHAIRWYDECVANGAKPITWQPS